MDHPIELESAIREAEMKAHKAYETNDLSFENNIQNRVGACLLQHALELADASLILVKRNLPCPALVLERPMIEAYIRGLWAWKCAQDKDLDNFLETGQPKPYKLTELAKLVREELPKEAEWQDKILALTDGTETLNDLTHGGAIQIKYRDGKQIIEPNVPTKKRLDLLALGNDVREKCDAYLRDMMEV